MLSSLHSKSFSGGRANKVYRRRIRLHILPPSLPPPTTLPRDLDMATPPFCTMPCVKSRAAGRCA